MPTGAAPCAAPPRSAARLPRSVTRPSRGRAHRAVRGSRRPGLSRFAGWPSWSPACDASRRHIVAPAAARAPARGPPVSVRRSEPVLALNGNARGEQRVERVHEAAERAPVGARPTPSAYQDERGVRGRPERASVAASTRKSPRSWVTITRSSSSAAARITESGLVLRSGFSATEVTSCPRSRRARATNRGHISSISSLNRRAVSAY